MDKDRAMHIGAVIKRLRKEIGYTQEELAENSKLNRTYTGELERNEKEPSLYVTFKLAKGFGLEPDQFVKIISDTIDFNRMFEEEE
ncbi:helix-turn-helix transcriptional regulator [Bacillus salipaludis]|uniref:helix-turn-helix domain-containing protein n=1 Tax=Bacillus salipaludis TaxID=2547811 RepID=UPI002E1B5C50|nr:helix-turn-helix transcriptional regulator [Bacillus salipaludis]